MPEVTGESHDDFIIVETCTDPCGPNTVQRAASTAADDDFIIVETFTDPCGPNTVQREASTAADDDFILTGETLCETWGNIRENGVGMRGKGTWGIASP